MSSWWLSDWTRLATERAAVDALATREDWFTLTRWTVHEFRLAVEGVITAHGATYPVRLVYPDLFPNVPAWVEPQDETTRWSGHQYGAGGALCLELRPDNWQANATGADVLQSAFNLLYRENPLGAGEKGTVPSAHAVGEVQSYGWYAQPAMIGVGCVNRLIAGEVEDFRAVWWLTGSGVRPVLLFDRHDEMHGGYPTSTDLLSLRVVRPVHVTTMNAPLPQPADRSALARELGASFDGVSDDQLVVVLAITPDREHARVYVSPNVRTVEVRSWVVLPDDAGQRAGRTATREQGRVTVVGVGSVGSNVAELLVRSGVRRLVLVDGDVLLPGNLERHTLDWRDVGARKAEAVRQRLIHIAPDLEVTVITSNLNWQRSAQTYAKDVEMVASGDVIVNATGDVPTGLLLGALAAQHDKAFVSVEVFEGGLGCLTARFMPGRDPTFVEGRAAYEAYCDEQMVMPPTSGPRDYEALTFGGAPVQADAAAVAAAAAQAARITLDVLDDCVEPTTAPWILTGFRSGWLFERQGESIALDIPIPSRPEPTDLNPELVAWATALAKEAVDAARTSS